MNTYTPPSLRQRTRQAIIDFALARPRSHWVTLNCHRDLSDDTANRCLKRWRIELMRRLHGQRFYLLPEIVRFEFAGAREFTQAREPHFHLVCSVPEPLTERFERVAPERWKAIVPSGTCHIERIDDDPDSPRRILGYTFKRFDLGSELAYVDSRLFR